jgi:hypothetical protein
MAKRTRGKAMPEQLPSTFVFRLEVAEEQMVATFCGTAPGRFIGRDDQAKTKTVATQDVPEYNCERFESSRDCFCNCAGVNKSEAPCVTIHKAAGRKGAFMVGFLLWCILFVLCWPLALLALVLYPFVWLVLLPFRLLGLIFHLHPGIISPIPE